MPHIHTAPGEHDFTASAFVIVNNQDEPRLLLHWHKKLKIYMQYGGHIETSENPWQAISHEIYEESGYALSQFMVLQPATSIRKLSGVTLHPLPVSSLTHKFPGMNHYHSDLAYAFVTTEEPKSIISKNESQKSRLLNCAELEKLDSSEIPEDVREIGLFVLTKCLKDWEKVPVANFAL